MIFLYYLACLINTFLIVMFTDLRASDALWWLWTAVPIVAHLVGREIENRK